MHIFFQAGESNLNSGFFFDALLDDTSALKTTDSSKSNSNNLFDDIIEIKSDHSNESNSLADFLVQTTTNKEKEHATVNPIDADLFAVSEYTNSTLDDKTSIVETKNTSSSVELNLKNSPPLLPNFILGPIQEPDQF